MISNGPRPLTDNDRQRLHMCVFSDNLIKKFISYFIYETQQVCTKRSVLSRTSLDIVVEALLICILRSRV